MTPTENDIEIARLMGLRDEQTHIIRNAQYGLENCGWRGEEYKERKTREYTAEIEAARSETKRINAEIEPLEENYRREGWQRYWLVNNSNGHVHTSMSCTTCFFNTEYLWLPDCSGMSEDELVAEFGEKVCTVCCPSAPITPGLVGRRDREAQEAKDKEKSEKLAAKLEKALLPDGSALHIPGEGDPKTLIAGQRLLSHLIENLLWYGPTHPFAENWKNGIEALLTAIANKTGEDRESIRETVTAKQAKKVEKQRG